MKTKLLPLIWWTGGLLGCTATVALAVRARLDLFFIYGLAWISTIVAGLFAGSVALQVNPGLRFSTSLKEDGMGHVHGWADFVISVTIIFVMSLIVFLVAHMLR